MLRVQGSMYPSSLVFDIELGAREYFLGKGEPQKKGICQVVSMRGHMSERACAQCNAVLRLHKGRCRCQKWKTKRHARVVLKPKK
jgi:hypothetical protein